MKLLIVGDAVVPTGFSKCCHALADYLHSHSYSITILGINYYGSPHSYPYPIYPCQDPTDGGYHFAGESRLPRLIFRDQPDIVIILQDPWNIKGYFTELARQYDYLVEHNEIDIISFKWPIFIGWLAVDANNQVSASELNDRLDHVVAWTGFGAQQLALGGGKDGGWKGNTSIIPLGVDTDLYYPRDKAESRAKVLPSEVGPDDFVVGFVGRNQARKRIDLIIECFAEWYHSRPSSTDNVWLYLHMAPTGEGSVDVESLARYYKISNNVILAEGVVGKGTTEAEMPYVYSSLDLFLVLSQAEGWCLPALEAMACGVPVIAGDHSAIGDWARDAAVLVPCSSSIVNAPMNKSMHTVGMVPDKDAVVIEIDRMYQSWKMRGRMIPGRVRGVMVPDPESVWYREHRDKGIELADQLPWSNMGWAFDQLLQELYRARFSPTMTDMMISPEAMDEALGDMTPEEARQIALDAIEMAKKAEREGKVEFDQQSIDDSLDDLITDTDGQP